jgi:membrane-associated protease RseP (regulator of RpoE activity)
MKAGWKQRSKMGLKRKPSVDPQVKQLIDWMYLQVSPFFRVYEVNYHAGAVYFYGMSRVSRKIIQESLTVQFASRGYNLAIESKLGEEVIAAVPFKQGKDRVWINAVLAIATFFTTMFAGASMFGADVIADPISAFEGLPFTIAIMGVLGSHEMGHYLAARRHGMQTSLPYFIPFPSIIGTMGAVIKHKGMIPDRKSLFDVAVSGPLVGLVASVIVTIIGLMQPPLEFSQAPGTLMIDLQMPPLFAFLQWLMGSSGQTIHPVAFAGWVGMFVTLLNLLPSGQLDGGHAMRAMLGEKAKYISSAMPVILGLVAIYIGTVMGQNAGIWFFWAVLLFLFATAGHPRPMEDSHELDGKRMLLGIVTFVLGLLCFTPVPFTVVTV